MGNDASRDHYQGLLIEDSRISIWDAQTTATEAGPKPGVPEPQNQTGMTLQASGSQSADKDLRIRTQRGGFSEPDGAGFCWKNSADTLWRGRDVPGIITHYDVLKWSDFSVPQKWYIQPHAITLEDESILCAFYERDDSEALPFSVTVGKRSGGAWTYVRVNTTATQPTADEAEFHPCLCLLPSGRVLLFHWVEDLVRDVAQVRMWFSDDDGSTWAIGQDNVLDNPVSISAALTGYDVRRLRVAYCSGQILMMCHLRSNNTAYTGRDVIRQYASSNEGNSFDSIEEWDGVNYAGGFVDVIESAGHFVVGYIQTEPSSTAQPHVFRLGNAYQRGTSVAHTVIAPVGWGDYGAGAAGPLLTDGDLSIASTPQGTLYATGRTTPNGSFGTYDETNQCMMLRSDDYGDTWAGIGQFAGLSGLTAFSGGWYNQNKVDTCPRAFQMTYAQGRMAVLHNWRANPGITGTIDETSLAVSYLGGSSTVTMPGFQRFQTGFRRVNFEDTYLPFDLPGAITTRWSSGWFKAGGGTEALLNGYLKLGDGAASSIHYRTRGLPAGHTIEQGIIFQCSMAIEAGGSLVTNDVAVTLNLDDGGPNGFSLVVRFNVDQVLLVDGTSGATIGAIPMSVQGNGVDVLIGMQGSKFASWLKPRDDASDRNWTIGPTSTGLTNTGGGGNSQILWGNLATSGSISRWWTLQSVTGSFTGLQIAEGQVNPNDLMQAPFSASGTYVDDGVVVRAVDGPTIRADEWKIATRYDYPLSNVLDPNPRRVWRSTSNAAQTISFQLSSLGNSALESDVLGIGLYNCNFPFAQLHGYNSSTASWVSLGNIAFYEGLNGLPFARTGDNVKANGVPAGAAPVIYAGEFEDALFCFGATSAHTIKSHLSGKWSNANTKPASLVLDGITGAEAASGNAQILSKDNVILFHLQGSDYQAFRITLFAPGGFIPAMKDSFFQIGRCVVGPVIVHGDQTSWGRVIETSSGTEVQEARDRTVKTRKIAPTRRVIEYGWTDAVDTTDGINPAGDPDPDYVMPNTAGSSEPIALKDITPFDFEGVFHLLSGPNKQVIYLPRIDKQALGTTQTLNRRHQSALCRITSPVRLESVQGEEIDSEVIRVGTVSFTEDV